MSDHLETDQVKTDPSNDKRSDHDAPGSGQTQGSDESNRQDSDINAAMQRFEKAVQDLVAATAGHLGDRATRLIDETSKRLEAELRLKRVTGDPQAEGRDARRRRHSSRHRSSERGGRRSRRRSSRMTLDPDNKKIAGVCGALARNFGLESWAVRLAALTGLLFLPQIVFPAYWIAYFIMDKSKPGESDRAARPRGKRARRRTSAADGPPPPPPRSEEQFIPRRTLRNTTVDLTQAELRLRRLESFVTSDQYELQKQLAQIERDTDHTAPKARL